MSYHDRKLLGSTKRKGRVATGRFASLLRGINEMTLSPSAPVFRQGSLRDDQRALAGDMRRAMKQLETSE